LEGLLRGWRGRRELWSLWKAQVEMIDALMGWEFWEFDGLFY
jgi:hypothetical protein